MTLYIMTHLYNDPVYEVYISIGTLEVPPHHPGLDTVVGHQGHWGWVEMTVNIGQLSTVKI